MTAGAEATHVAAFGVHRHPNLHLRRPPSGFTRGFAVGAALALVAALTALLALPGRPHKPLSTEAQPIEVAV